MNQQAAPYCCHVFVCLNDRHGERKSCADGAAAAIRDYLKAEVERRGWKPRVRVSQSGCLGLCQQGPNVILYPQGVWFSGVTQADADQILTAVEKFITCPA
jgi:(2Fe-2S) ferredoxin